MINVYMLVAVLVVAMWLGPRAAARCGVVGVGGDALPDVRAQCLASEGECTYIRQGISACNITNMLNFLHS